jgi:hypothetical protein
MITLYTDKAVVQSGEFDVVIVSDSNTKADFSDLINSELTVCLPVGCFNPDQAAIGSKVRLLDVDLQDHLDLADRMVKRNIVVITDDDPSADPVDPVETPSVAEDVSEETESTDVPDVSNA